MAVEVTGVVAVKEVIEGGTVLVWVQVQTGDQAVQLHDLPDWLLSDDLGNLHKPNTAAPHLAPTTAVTARFNEIPSFGSLSLTIAENDPAVTGHSGDEAGQPLEGGTFPVVVSAWIV